MPDVRNDTRQSDSMRRGGHLLAQDACLANVKWNSSVNRASPGQVTAKHGEQSAIIDDKHDLYGNVLAPNADWN